VLTVSVLHLSEHLCSAEASIRHAIRQLDHVGKKEGGRGFHFLVLVDNERRLVGTLTDGDLRRGIISGVGIDSPVREVACLSPRYGLASDSIGNKIKLQMYSKQANYLPIVDHSNVICDILMLSGQEIDACSVLIMAGGFGKRLGDRTRRTPKPLLHIRGKPILTHIMDRLSKMAPERIFISVHYLADQVAEFCSSRPESNRIALIHELTPLGTAGAIGRIPKPLDHPLLICNGDVLTSLNFEHFWRFFVEHEFDAIIAVAQHRLKIPYGVVRYAGDGEFLGMTEKPNLSHFVSAGIYIFSPLFVSLVSPEEAIDMPDLLTRGKELGLRIGLFPLHEYWTDIGLPEDFDNANADHIDGKP
jgi:dTDP-glucose pyrophosphorylase